MPNGNSTPFDPLSKVIELITGIGFDLLKDKAQRSEKIIWVLNQLGWKFDAPPANDFDGVYAYTLVFYGIDKPRPILEFFREPLIKNAFHRSFIQQNPKILEKESENLLDWHEIGKELVELDYHPRNEFEEFRQKFIEYALSTRSVPEILRDQSIEHIHKTFTELPTKVDVKNILENVSASEAERSQQTISKSLSDYLEKVITSHSTIELPVPIQEAFDTNLQRIPPEILYCFEDYEGRDLATSKNQIAYQNFLGSISRLSIPILLIGESGIGKTSLLQQIFYDQAKEYLEGTNSFVPILLKLSFYSHTRNLLSLIVEHLGGKGVQIESIHATRLLQDGRFIILLDAFDEVFDQYIPEIEQELQFMQENYPLCKFIITTRHFRLPSIFPCKKYKVLPLSYHQVEGVSKFYLPTQNEAFLQEIEVKQLMGLVSNTLLLILLILLYKQNGILPQSRGQILDAVVNRIKSINETKPKRVVSKLSWDVKMELITQLAYASQQQGFSYVLKKELAEGNILKKLNALQTARKIPLGVTINDAIVDLASTGFILAVEQSGLIFWHRAFLEYFACFEIIKHLENSNKILKKYLVKPDWQEMLPYAISKAKHFEKLIDKVLHLNVFIAAYSILEHPISRIETHREVIDALVKKCSSAAIPIRVIAVSILRQFKDEYATHALRGLLKSKFVNIQKVALVETAKRKTQGAYEIVWSKIDWNAHTETWAEGNSSNAVIEALSEFDDLAAHREIIKKWREKPDIFTSQSCHYALLRIIKRHGLDNAIKEELLDFFLSNEDDAHHFHKLWDLSDILIAFKDNNIVSPLIKKLIENSDSESTTLNFQIQKILSCYDDLETTKALIDCSLNTNLNTNARRYFAEALANSKGNIPIEVYISLAKSDDFIIQGHAILGLSRFEFEEYKSIILKAIHPPTWEDSRDMGHKYAYVQRAAFEVLAKNQQIELLLSPENRVEYFYDYSLEILFKSIIQHQLLSFIPLLNGLFDHARNDSDAIEVAFVLAQIGESTRAQEIIIECFRRNKSSGVIYEILKGVHFLPQQTAISIINDVVELEAKATTSGYTLELCFQSLELIGTSEAAETVIHIIEKLKETKEFGIYVERGFRALEQLSPRNKEEWAIEFINQNSDKIELMSLRRALEALGSIGGLKSLPLLLEYFKKHTGEIQVTCFWAIRQIYIKEGMLWYNNEETLDD